MDTRAETATATIREDFVVTRVFDAPRELVWKAWTDPKHYAQWGAPHGFSIPLCELDVRPGGAYLIHMQGPDGVVYPDKGEYREVVEPERLVSIGAVLDDAGHPQFEVLTTVTFAEHNGKTELTVRSHVVQATPQAAAALAGMDEGWNQTLDRLAEHLGHMK